MSDLSAATSQSSATDQLVEAYKATQASRVNNLKDRKTVLETRQSFYNSLNSKLNSLVGSLDKFGEWKTPLGETEKRFVKTDDIDDDFVTRSAVSGNTANFTATADSKAMTGISSLKIQRLAASDIFVTKQLDLAAPFTGLSEGTYSFTLKNGSIEKEISIAVSADPKDQTNEAVMKKIANAVNDEKEDLNINASFVKDTETTGRLTFMSADVGSANTISFSGTNGTIFETLGMDESYFADPLNRTAQSGGSAGFKKSNVSDLNAQIEVNGISVTRSSNEIEDVLQGVTITLLKVQETDEQPISLTVDVDTKAIEDLINPLLKTYNDTLAYLQANRTTGKQDPAIITILSRFRSLSTSEMVPGAGEGEPKYLSDIGIKIGKDGSLSISDKDKLKEYLKSDTSNESVAKLFTGEKGFANQIYETINNLRPDGSGSTGLIKSRITSLTSQIKSADDRINTTQGSIDREAEALRKEYNSYLKTYLDAQNQYSMIGLLGSSNSLLSSAYSTS